LQTNLVGTETFGLEQETVIGSYAASRLGIEHGQPASDSIGIELLIPAAVE
jgi:hypothetical protein